MSFLERLYTEGIGIRVAFLAMLHSITVPVLADVMEGTIFLSVRDVTKIMILVTKLRRYSRILFMW